MKISSKEINRLAFPAIISGIAEPVISLVDTIFVGKLGTEALAGLGIATSFFLLIIWILAQSKTAVSATVSKYYGKEKPTGTDSLYSAIFGSCFHPWTFCVPP